jgi:putative ABC transport system substrate-binding protein
LIPKKLHESKQIPGHKNPGFFIYVYSIKGTYMIKGKIKIIVLITVGTLLGIGSIMLLKRHEPTQQHDEHITIGILQTASHPALDAARQGFEEVIHQELPDAVLVTHNAQGSLATAHTIAQSFHAHTDIDGIFAIATPAAQAQAAVEKTKPIFIAAVTDPASAGLTHTNVTGSTDAVDSATIIELLMQLVPQAKTIGLLYNSAELNSQVQIAHLKTALQRHGLAIVPVSFTSEADVAAATTSACNKVDAIIIPNDNILSASIDLVASIALKNRKPLIASDTMLVKRGVLAARGVDYKASGAQAAHYAVAVLRDGKKLSDLPIVHPAMSPVMINKKTAQALNIAVPEKLAHQITWIAQEKPS